MDKIIEMLGDRDKVLNMSLYEYIESQYKNGNKFIACHVTEEEYKCMLQQIKNGCLNERNSRISRDSMEYDKFRYMLAYNPISNNILLANYNDFNAIGTYTIDNDGIHFDEEGLQFPKDYSISRVIGGTKIYTTTSYEEVIEHYSNIMDNNIPNESIEKIIDKILNNPRDFYIKISQEISIEEREYIKTLIENKSCINCSNGTCRVEANEKTYNDICVAWDNKELIGRQKILTSHK